MHYEDITNPEEFELFEFYHLYKKKMILRNAGSGIQDSMDTPAHSTDKFRSSYKRFSRKSGKLLMIAIKSKV